MIKKTEFASTPRGLFLNQGKAQCSIYESGQMVYECMRLSDRYTLDYMEISSAITQIGVYDFYVFNYHHATMSWLNTASLRQLPGKKFTLVLETLPSDPFVLCPADAFDAYLALDPTMERPDDPRVYAFPRPLEVASSLPLYQKTEVPIIGSFGFATPGKGFELLVAAVNSEFEKAVVRINIPSATFADNNTNFLHKCGYAAYLGDLCRRVAKPGIQVEITNYYLDKKQLIEWCAQNTINCFMYNRTQPGISATTDQAITSGRPMAVSINETFRHIHKYIKPYPFQSLNESIVSSQSKVLQMQQDWAPANFTKIFEQVLEDYAILPSSASITHTLISPAPTLLIVSHRAKQCGIHEYGKNIAEALSKSKKYHFIYSECSSSEELAHAIAEFNPNAIIYNYYHITMPWLTPTITRCYSIPQLAIMHEVNQEDADKATADVFDFHLCPDPTLVENNPLVFKTRRLIPPYLNYKNIPDTTIIGSFGFGFGDKGFERLMQQVQEEFDEAIVRLHMPFNDIVDPQGSIYAIDTASRCRNAVTKPGIRLEISHHFIPKHELLDFLASNTLNAFFYDIHKHRGISSVIEHALAVQRPLAINRCGMFRHMHVARPSICIEDACLRDIIANDIAPLVPFYNDWSEANFIMDYERIIDMVFSNKKNIAVQSVNSVLNTEKIDVLSNPYVRQKDLASLSDANLLGENLYTEGKIIEALKYFMQIIKSTGRDASRSRAFNNIGVIAHGMNDISTAEQMLQSALDNNGTNFDALLNLSDIYMIQCRHNEALKVLERALDAYPRDEQILEKHALCKSALNDLVLENGSSLQETLQQTISNASKKLGRKEADTIFVPNARLRTDEVRFNRILDNQARELYKPVINMLFALVPDMMARKIPEANVQQAFVLDTVERFSSSVTKPKILCVGCYEDTAAAGLKALGYLMDEIDPAINYDLNGFFNLPTTKKAIYDIIFSTSVIEHVRDDELFIRQIEALLAPGGVAVITCDYKDSYRPGDHIPQEDFRLYTQKDFTSRLLPLIPDCWPVDTSQWDCPEPDFVYTGCHYTFATLVFQKKRQTIIMHDQYSDAIHSRRLTLVNTSSGFCAGIMPLGLTSISAYLKQYGNFRNIVLLDSNCQNIYTDYNTSDIVGITAVSQDIAKAITFANYVKTRQNIPIILGGVHISTYRDLPEPFDIGVIGEGEQTMFELMNLPDFSILNLHNVKGICYRDHGTVIFNEEREMISNLDMIPFPDREITNIDFYLKSQKVIPYHTGRTLTLLTSRGCPFNCVFCSTRVHWKKFRAFSAERVVAEIELMIDRYNIELIHIFDDLFIADKKRLLKIHDLIVEKGIDRKVKFMCLIRSDMVNDQIMQLLKEMNVVVTGAGMESGSDKVLKYLKRNTTTVEMNKKLIELSIRYRIPTMGSFMIGNPHETIDDLEDTLEFITSYRSTPYFTPLTYIATTFPGTEFWDYAKKNNIPVDNFEDIVMDIPTSINILTKAPLFTKIPLNIFFEMAQRFLQETIFKQNISFPLNSST